MKRNIYLDKSTFDFATTPGKQLRFTENNAEFMAQKIETNLGLMFNEWFLNRDLGFPYYDELLKKNPDLKKVRTLLIAYILGIVGVKDVISLDAKFISESRTLKINFVIQIISGEIVEGEI